MIIFVRVDRKIKISVCRIVIKAVSVQCFNYRKDRLCYSLVCLFCSKHLMIPTLLKRSFKLNTHPAILFSLYREKKVVDQPNRLLYLTFLQVKREKRFVSIVYRQIARMEACSIATHTHSLIHSHAMHIHLIKDTLKILLKFVNNLP